MTVFTGIRIHPPNRQILIYHQFVYGRIPRCQCTRNRPASLRIHTEGLRARRGKRYILELNTYRHIPHLVGRKLTRRRQGHGTRKVQHPADQPAAASLVRRKGDRLIYRVIPGNRRRTADSPNPDRNENHIIPINVFESDT